MVLLVAQHLGRVELTRRVVYTHIELDLAVAARRRDEDGRDRRTDVDAAKSPALEFRYEIAAALAAGFPIALPKRSVSQS